MTAATMTCWWLWRQENTFMNQSMQKNFCRWRLMGWKPEGGNLCGNWKLELFFTGFLVSCSIHSLVFSSALKQVSVLFHCALCSSSAVITWFIFSMWIRDAAIQKDCVLLVQTQTRVINFSEVRVWPVDVRRHEAGGVQWTLGIQRVLESGKHWTLRETKIFLHVLRRGTETEQPFI